MKETSLNTSRCHFLSNIRRTDSVFIIGIILWITLILSSLIFAWHYIGESSFSLAIVEARSSFDKDLLYRRWATMHGGVYVPPTEKTMPDPYLSQITKRDITTIDGDQFTLVNPARMMRQVHELGNEPYGKRSRITSLNPVRPENAADNWEKISLQSFESGVKETHSLEMSGDEPVIRFMRPMITETGCLKCHAEHGYKEGDIRGGISISIPFSHYLERENEQKELAVLSHALIGLVGLLVISFSKNALVRSHNSLQKSENLLEKLVDLLGEGVVLLDTSERILMWNRSAAEIFDVDSGKTKGQSISVIRDWECIREDGSKFNREDYPYSHTLQTGEPCNGTIMGIRKEAQDTKWIKINTRPLLTRKESKPYAIIISFSDITDLKLTEKELRVSEARFQVAIKSSRLISSEVDRDLRYRWIYSPHPDFDISKFIGKRDDELDDSEAAQTLVELKRQVIESSKGIRKEIVFNRRNGTYVYDITIEPLFNDEGIIVGAASASLDITDRKRSEALRQSELRLQAANEELQRQNQELTRLWDKSRETENELSKLNHDLNRQAAELAITNIQLENEKRLLTAVMEALPTGIAIIDKSGNAVRANKAYEKILGEPRPEALFFKDYSLYKAWWADTDEPVAPDEWASSVAMKNGKDSLGQIIRIQRCDGTELYVINSASPVYNNNGSIVGSAVAIQDVTELKQVERALYESDQRLRLFIEQLEQRVEQRTRELQETQSQYLHAEKLSAIGKLSASIAHEFNNPLQGVMTILKGLKRRAILEEEDKELLNLAIVENERMKTLIQSLQDFNKPSSGKRVVMDIHASIDSLLLLYKSDFKRKAISTELYYAEGLPRIQAIPDQIKQVFLNLLNNATDACFPNGGTITISTWYENRKVAVAIKDTGVGIAPEKMDLIFQPFFTTKSEVKGTGLGLSVCHGIIQNHQGEINVESRPGEGSTFTILLPARGNSF